MIGVMMMKTIEGATMDGMKRMGRPAMPLIHGGLVGACGQFVLQLGT